MLVIELTIEITWSFTLIECMLSQRMKQCFFMMSFNITAKVYATNNTFFFTKIMQIEKPGGDWGGTRGERKG